MNIGIIGAGDVGGTLGRLWATKGHSIMYGARDVQSANVRTALGASGKNAQVGSTAEAVAFGEVVVIAVPHNALRDVIATGGDWNGKIVIDAVNYFGTVTEGSVGQEIAHLAAGAKVVKAFNTLGAEWFATPKWGDITLSMYICGDDPLAKSVVAGLTEELGFDVVDCGGLENSILLENLARLWVTLSRSGMGRDFAFVLVKR